MFRVEIWNKDKEEWARCGVSGLTAEESLELIKQLIENLICKECKGNCKVDCDQEEIDDCGDCEHNQCPACHGSGKDNEKLVEVVKVCFPEINKIAASYGSKGVYCDSDGAAFWDYFMSFTDYLKEQK